LVFLADRDNRAQQQRQQETKVQTHGNETSCSAESKDRVVGIASRAPFT